MKRVLSVFLACAFLLALLPTSALAAETDSGKAIQLGTSGIKDPTAEGNTYYTPNSYVYFGVNSESSNTPIKWRVLDADKANGGITNGMFLLSEYLLASEVKFNENGGNQWQGSNAQGWCKTYAESTSNFSTAEQSAMLGVAKTDNTGILYGLSWGASSLTGQDKMFFLSARELSDYVGNYDDAPGLAATFVGGSVGVWWLRSPRANWTSTAGAVYSNGNVNYDYVDYDLAARPAFNLNLNSVLFTSAAESGKADTAVDGDLTAVGTAGTDWKLTLKDDSRSFTATTATTTIEAGQSLSISYSGAQTGDDEYVSAMLAQGDTILYYGRIAQNSASGTASVTIPADLAAGSYTLKVFSEQYNGDYKTDYASAFVDISLTVTDTTAPTLSNGTATRESETNATVKFTSDEAGTYYYAVVDSGATVPSDPTTNGTSGSCVKGENTINLTTLTAGKKDIYIVVKDAADNVSETLKITIPTYIAPSYGISASPGTLNFGSETVGYEAAPAAKTVTVTNTGNQNVTVTLPTGTNYTVTARTGFSSNTATLAPNGTAAFTVQPNTGLAVGSHNETLSISGSNNTVNANLKLKENAEEIL